MATTRAKKRLYLIDHTNTPTKGTFRALIQDQVFSPIESILSELNQAPETQTTYHLPLTYYTNQQPMARYENNGFLTLSDSTARTVGVITHELLQTICTFHPHSAADVPWALMNRALKQAGLDQRPELARQIKTMISHIFDHPKGRWIISPHQQEKNEYALLAKHENTAGTRIIDRTFIAEGIHWIIDFKTGEDDQDKQAEHKNQVNHYAALLAPLSNHPIHGGIYYLTNNHWMSWKIKDQTPTLANFP